MSQLHPKLSLPLSRPFLTAIAFFILPWTGDLQHDISRQCSSERLDTAMLGFTDQTNRILDARVLNAQYRGRHNNVLYTVPT